MLQFFSNSHQLLVKGVDGLLVLIHLLFLDILMLLEPTDHSLFGDAPILEYLHAYRHLETKTTVNKRRKYEIEQSMRKTHPG